MAFDYDPSLLGVDPVMTVRFLLQDTTQSEHFFENEEIEYALDTWYPIYGTYEYVAATLADTLAARYAREASISADGVSVSLGPVGDQYRALAVSLRAQHRGLLVGGSPDAGGITPGEGQEPNTRNTAFGTGMHDDIAAGPQDYGNRDAAFNYPAEYYPGV